MITDGLPQPCGKPTRRCTAAASPTAASGGTGTTLTAAAFIGDEPDGKLRLALVNVGDSRAYLVNGRERVIDKLTDDHSVVEEMVRTGELTPQEAAVHPHRHIFDPRVLGVEPVVEPDCWELDLEPGSRLLLWQPTVSRTSLDEPGHCQSASRRGRHRQGSGRTRAAGSRARRHRHVTVVVLDVLQGESSGVTDDVDGPSRRCPGHSVARQRA